jgi:hypothetical protein
VRELAVLVCEEDDAEGEDGDDDGSNDGPHSETGESRSRRQHAPTFRENLLHRS